MTHQPILKPILLTAALGLSLLTAHAGSAFLPAPKQVVLTPSLSYQSFDEFRAGNNNAALPQNIIRRYSRAHLDVGLTNDIAFDASLGYANVSSFAGKETALADTYLGLRYRLASETNDGGFAAATRLGITLPGSYDTGVLHAPGDDAFGADLSISLSKHLFSILRGNATLGYYYNTKDVPDSVALQLGTVASLSQSWKFDYSWKYFTATSGLDIAGQGFTGLGDLPKVKERGQVIELGLAYADQGGRYYRIYASQLYSGKNVGKERTFGTSISFTF